MTKQLQLEAESLARLEAAQAAGDLAVGGVDEEDDTIWDGAEFTKVCCCWHMLSLAHRAYGAPCASLSQ